MNKRMTARVLVPILAVVAASLVACSSSGGSVASPQATAVATAPAPTTAAKPSVAATPSSAATPSASPASPDPLAEGDYVSPPLTAEMMVAAVEAHGLDPADARTFIAGEGYKENEVVTMRLADGQLTLLQSLDGATPIDGWHGPYEFVDGQTFVASDSYPITYGFRWEGDKLHISVLKDLFPDPFDLVAQVALYESAPFTRVP
jgi:hypothetical protein